MMMRSGLLHAYIFFIVLTGLPSSAHAECTDAQVKRLAQQGRTVTSIARTCKMERDEVRSILDEEAEKEKPNEKEPRARGLPSGAPVGQCGCWGPAVPGSLQPHPMCRSGYATPSSCNVMCPMGGLAWRGVCS